MKNMQQLMKQAQKMQEQMMKAQEELGTKTVEGTAGGGVVSIVVSGHKQVQSVTIKPEAVDPDDVEMLQDLVLAAINEAMKKVDEMTQSEMGKYTKGMNMPGLF
ncbi:YbaB/EbfC family nucleoid-associated protein [Tumebacillus sp. ITR2]|jgi:DNA-binding YbaB/EbfC family protein|uniref:Nucleoid-associated protein JJB07_20615 n=1 Tax=Tumebacillus amylolyticus TaxID=2801339 RepID=A0ABS1JFH1_9BACL|nr:YbaB/EbfC family nucleoid-associated protein [Tumebacillus amylolyticus]MBL0388998.1 YbaB/EbfC family nucleoid-associated protein [Tumebacillus amylolyticus]